MPAKAGRPTLIHRDTSLNIRLPSAKLAVYREAAARDGRSLTNWIECNLDDAAAAVRGPTMTPTTAMMIDTIERRAVDDTARYMMARGIELTHEQAADLGDAGMDWLRNRLGLTVTETDRGVTCAQRRT